MKLGLALAGGGIRGIAHAGVLKALEENNIEIVCLGGTSSGSMITALYAIGYTPDEIYNLFKKYASTIVKLNSNIIRKEIKNFILKHKICSQGINNGEFIEEIFNKKAQEKQISNINQIKMPIVIPAVDMTTGEEYMFTSVKSNKKNYISTIDIGKAVRASSSFPVIYEPMKYKDKLFLDGGILNNIPAKAVKDLGADKIISVKFDSNKIEPTSNAVDIVVKVSDLMSEKISDEDSNATDYTITVPTDGAGILDISKIDYCFESGYETTKKQIKQILNCLDKT
ncbi:MAG: patatin-like phospholipase family protein [Clostridia bacterium]